MTSTTYDVDILMIGHFAMDRNVVDGRGEVASGGGVYFGSMALRQLGVRVAVVTRLHPDDFWRLEEMEQAGVRVYASAATETSGIANYYSSADMERRVCEPLGFAGPFTPGEIPPLKARIYMVASIIAGEVDLPLLKELALRGPVAIDVQGFVRVREGCDLVFHPWPDMAEGLAHVTYLKTDKAEAELLTGQTDLREAARSLAEYGPREIVLTESSGVTVYAGGEFHHAPFTPSVLKGRTGRGDTCFSTYLGRRLIGTAEEATRLAGAVTTLKQEQPGPWRGTLADAQLLMARQRAREDSQAG
ncbi:MAG: PfkB family carbohydrate kinase [Anaerolineae bacterium]